MAGMGVSPRLFRILLLASPLLGIAAGTVDIVIPSLIPQELSDAQAKLETGIWDSADWGSVALLLLAGVVLGVLGVSGLIGLFLFRPWGRTISVIGTGLALPVYLVLGPVLQSSWSYLLQEISMLLWGGLLALAYFSPLSVRFGSAPADPAGGAPAPSPRSALGTVALVIVSAIAGIGVFVAVAGGFAFYKVMDWSAGLPDGEPALEQGKALPAPMDRPARPDC